MRNIFIIAKNTFKIEIRDKILYAIIGFGVLYVMVMLFMSQLVLQELPMVKSFGLLGIYFFNAVIALFLGTTSFYKDVDQKIVYFILAKPVSRAQFVIGKFFGLCLVVLFASAILAVAYVGVVMHAGGGFDAIGLLAIAMQFLEMALFLAFAIFATTFSSSLLSIVYTSAVFFAGHIVSSLLTDAQAMGIGGIKLLIVKILYYILPNLEKFDIRAIAIHPVAMPFLSFFLSFCYAAAYIVFLLFAAIWIFEKKEL
jgi:ABC-type transport system involved in multi-copper enzyme maturation permease subunit